MCTFEALIRGSVRCASPTWLPTRTRGSPGFPWFGASVRTPRDDTAETLPSRDSRTRHRARHRRTVCRMTLRRRCVAAPSSRSPCWCATALEFTSALPHLSWLDLTADPHRRPQRPAASPRSDARNVRPRPVCPMSTLSAKPAETVRCDPWPPRDARRLASVPKAGRQRQPARTQTRPEPAARQPGPARRPTMLPRY